MVLIYLYNEMVVLRSAGAGKMGESRLRYHRWRQNPQLIHQPVLPSVLPVKSFLKGFEELVSF